MYEQRKSPFSIKEYLRQPDTQKKIQRKIIEARSAATVTITRAADLFGFSDTQLRDWDKLGFVRPPRSDGDKQEDKKHRQYSRAELDVLAAIRILRDGGYSITEIRQNIEVIRDIADQLGHEVFTLPEESGRKLQIVETTQERASMLPIDQLLDNADNELFWRFYAANALRLSLSLLAEYNPNTIIGLFMPLGSNVPPSVTTANIADLGECLIGWLRPNFSFYLLYDPLPAFEVHTDFRMHPLQTMKNGFVQDETRCDNTWIVVQRRAGQFNISSQVLTISQRLLAALYERKQEWLPSFVAGQRGYSFPIVDFVPEAADDPTKRMHLTHLADLAVSLGRDKSWRFACILEPHNSQLPVSEHQLILQATSENAPKAYKDKESKTIISPTDTVISVSMRAYQSGRICYRHRAVAQDKSIFNYDLELPIGSCIAVPIGGEEAKPLGVMYLVSSQQNAFDENDQRVLRMIARMVQELLLTFQTRIKVAEQLKQLIDNPALADPAYKPFLSETDFVADMEILLADVSKREDLKANLQPILELPTPAAQREAVYPSYSGTDIVSFYCIDVNDQTRLTQKYGEIMTRNLSREFGRRIEVNLKTLFTTSDLKLYHAYVDRFYIRLGGIPLEEAKSKIWSLKDALELKPYLVNALRFTTEQRTPSEMLIQETVSVRIGVNSYPYLKLLELMQRPDNQPYSTSSVTALILNDFSGLLRKGPGVHHWNPLEWQWTELFREKREE
jgi:DNA-binding transcriptional MerR regulator